MLFDFLNSGSNTHINQYDIFIAQYRCTYKYIRKTIILRMTNTISVNFCKTKNSSTLKDLAV